MFIPMYQQEMCERAEEHIKPPDGWYRASGDVLCSVCSRPYYDHPQAVPHLWLHLTCDGRYVKL